MYQVLVRRTFVWLLQMVIVREPVKRFGKGHEVRLDHRRGFMIWSGSQVRVFGCQTVRASVRAC